LIVGVLEHRLFRADERYKQSPMLDADVYFAAETSRLRRIAFRQIRCGPPTKRKWHYGGTMRVGFTGTNHGWGGPLV